MTKPTPISQSDTIKNPNDAVDVSEDELENDNTIPLDFERILKFDVGEFGPYQIFIGIIMGLISAFASFMVLHFLFISAVPEHRYVVNGATFWFKIRGECENSIEFLMF